MSAAITKQDYGTPRAFIHAVERRFGRLVCDLAAEDHNAKVEAFYTPQDDSLVQKWAEDFPTGNLWLNPEFVNIEPWAEKCGEESAKRLGLILMLTPASIGTDWFSRHVHRKAMVFGLSPRMAFDGTPPNARSGRVDVYPKDLMLSVYGHGLSGFDVWRWDR